MARPGVAFHAQRQPAGPALILGDRKLRYRQLVERTTHLAVALTAVGRGLPDRGIRG